MVKYNKPLLKILKKYEKTFQGTLGKYKGSDYTLNLQEDTKPYHNRRFLIKPIHKPNLKKDVGRLIKIGKLKKINNSHWPAPYFIIFKKIHMELKNLSLILEKLMKE